MTETRVECDNGSDELVLTIDRVASAWSHEAIEQSLLSRQEFEDFHHMMTFHRCVVRKKDAAVRSGHAVGFDAYHTEELKMEYLIVDMWKLLLLAMLGRRK